MKISFEIKDKDIAGRIGNLEIKDENNGISKIIETPALMPVYGLNNPILSIDELKEKFNAKILMTNAYMLFKSEEKKNNVIELGIHKFLNFDGIIAVDSGSYQLMKYGDIDISNSEILKFEEKIGAEIGSFLDIPTLPDAYKRLAEENLAVTLKRAKEAKELNLNMMINAAIQGSTFSDLRAKAAREISKNFELNAIGGIVRLMEEYRFEDLVNIIISVKKNIKAGNIVHAFGLGHPMLFGLAVGLGCDLFDSAAYALFAKDKRYITNYGTKKISELEYLPCSCPACHNKNPGDLNEHDIALHNLYVSYEEIRRVKQAIKENTLWEYIEMRAISHPSLYKAVKGLKKHRKFLSEFDPVTKRSAFFDFGFDCRTEIYNVKSRARNIKTENLIKINQFGNVPGEILDMYPLNVFGVKSNTSDEEKIKAIMNYQFGKDASQILDHFNLMIKRSRKTKRIRWIHDNKTKELLASIRASDHFIIPHKMLAEELHKFFKFPKLRIAIDDEAVPFVKEGKNVFAKFVINADKNLRAGDECLVVDKDDNLITRGALILSPRECLSFKRGVAVRTR
ncbi:MAG: hypothetical protein BWK75_00400 [Candidatus Altiarchaeales archaeon A3]|nr:MAG: hypothetical protein BWK75_00400 [Candidatus Altiarchaeales archaeon A3]